MIDAVLDTERHLVVAAIDRTGAGIDHMRDPAMARDLQQIQMAHHIRLDIGARILERIAHARLRAEMDDPVEVLIGETRFESGVIGEIGFDRDEAVARRVFDAGDAVALQLHRVIGIEAVETDDPLAPRAELFGNRRSDEPRRSGDQNRHNRALRANPASL